MLFLRPNDSLSDRSRSVGALLAGLCLSAALMACEQPAPTQDSNEPAETRTEVRAVPATGMTQDAGAVDHLALLPNGTARDDGLIIAAIRGGGFDAFNDFGERVFQTAGPSLTSLVAIPSFDMRGTRLALLFGSDSDRMLRGFIVLPGVEAIEPLPLDVSVVSDPVEGACLYRQGTGFIELALLHANRRATVWRMMDTGGERLTLTRTLEIALPFTGERCAGVDGDIVVGSSTGGLARVDDNGGVLADAEGIAIRDFAFTELYGRPVVLVPFANEGIIGVFDGRTLEEISAIEVRAEMSISGLAQPGAITVTELPFSGMGFSTGLAAIHDGGDNRIKLVTRDVLGRAVTAPE